MQTLSEASALVVGFVLWGALLLTMALPMGRIDWEALLVIGLPLFAALILVERICRSRAATLWTLALVPLATAFNFFVIFAISKATSLAIDDWGSVIALISGAMFVLLALAVPARPGAGD